MSHHRNPRALLTPAMHRVLDAMARAGQMPLHAMTPEQARAAYEKGASVLDIAPARIDHIENLSVPTRDGQIVPVRLYLPRQAQAQAPQPVLVYLHGGGFVVGSIATHDSLCRSLCHLAHCAVLSVDYRLAPEHRFPAAVDDCVVDRERKIVTTPAYMYPARIREARAGIQKLVEAVLGMA